MTLLFHVGWAALAVGALVLTKRKLGGSASAAPTGPTTPASPASGSFTAQVPEGWRITQGPSAAEVQLRSDALNCNFQIGYPALEPVSGLEGLGKSSRTFAMLLQGQVKNLKEIKVGGRSFFHCVISSPAQDMSLYKTQQGEAQLEGKCMSRDPNRDRGRKEAERILATVVVNA